jgi:hypothetical protein
MKDERTNRREGTKEQSTMHSGFWILDQDHGWTPMHRDLRFAPRLGIGDGGERRDSLKAEQRTHTEV